MSKHRKERRYPRERTVAEGEEWSSKKVFTTVHEYLVSQIHFTHSWQPVVVTLWAMGTYLHKRFPCYGHLWLNSHTTHSGKSKLLSALWTLGYKSTAPQLEPTAAVLYRFPSVTGGTLLLDEVDNLDHDKKSQVIAILNHYLRNGEVMRAFPGRNKKFGLERLPIYCPKVIAGIENLPVTLQDRCIKIALQRKKHSEEVRRFMPEDYERHEHLRDQLDAWGERKAPAILKAYEDRERLGVPTEVTDDRVRDILEPLFAIAGVLPKWVRLKLSEGAREIAQGRRSEEEESDPVVASVQSLTKAFPTDVDVWKLNTETALELLGDIPGLEDRAAVQKLLRKIGFHSQANRIGKQVVRGYRIPRKSLERLSRRYN
jgi:Protein of unknown function (DUF3631)